MKIIYIGGRRNFLMRKLAAQIADAMVKENQFKNNNTMEKKTIGEILVRTDFNVSKSDLVDEIKHKTAELIDLCYPLKARDPRLTSIAIANYEAAAMWAVKAATAEVTSNENETQDIIFNIPKA